MTDTIIFETNNKKNDINNDDDDDFIERINFFFISFQKTKF